MKYAASILALLVLTLSVSPCCDPDDHCMGDVENECADLPHDESDGDSMNCSPFYSCGTCSGCISFQFAFEFTFIPLNHLQQNIFYWFSYPNGFRHLPLKPPRLI